MNDWIVLYCERRLTDGEVLNSLTNLSFVIVGLAAFYLRPRERVDGRYLVGAGFVIAIGVGSALFHWHPHPATQALDIIPIALLTLLCGVTLTQRLATTTQFTCVMAGIVWLLASLAFAQFPEFLAGSMFYIPTLLWLVTLATISPVQRRRLLVIAGIFAAALTCRTVDLPLCNVDNVPIWHSAWHVLTAVCAGLLLQLMRLSGHTVATRLGTPLTPKALQ